MSQPRLSRSRQQAKAVQAGKRVETANSLTTNDFFDQFCSIEARTAIDEACSSQTPCLRVVYSNASDIESTDTLNRCFNLIESTSATDYQNSEIKWSPSQKRKEMGLPDMKYVVLLAGQNSPLNDSSSDPLAGFVSFMITYEDGHEVVYIYEIHFVRKWRGRGLGKKLMSVVEDIGRQVGVRKTMLTVFKANSQAVEWYQRLGYSEDEFSPRPRKLRNGTVKEASYTILSKPL